MMTIIRFGIVVYYVMLLCGCTAFHPVLRTELYGIDKRETKVNFDNRLLQECPPLPELADGQDVSIEENYKSITVNYSKCRNGKKALNDEVRNILDLKDDGTAVVKEAPMTPEVPK